MLICFLYCFYTSCLIPIDKPTDSRIIIPALQIVDPEVLVVVVRAITVRVDDRDMLAATENVSAVPVPDREDLPPCVVGIARDDFGVPVVDRNDVSLQILLEVKRLVVIDDAADAVLVIVERNKRVIAPFFPEDFCPVKRVSVPYAAYRLACADAVCVVGILDIVKGLELSAPLSRKPAAYVLVFCCLLN